METFNEFTMYFWLFHMIIFGPLLFIICVYLPELPVLYIKQFIMRYNSF